MAEHKMRDNTGEWFGSIPVDWTILALKYAFSIKKDKSICGFYIIKKDNIPIKLIVIEGESAKEIDIIKYDNSIKSEHQPAVIQNNIIHTFEEKVSIEYIKYTGKHGNLMNIYLNEHNIASYIQIYKRHIEADKYELYIIRGDKFPKLRIISNRTGIKQEIKILKFCYDNFSKIRISKISPKKKEKGNRHIRKKNA